MMPSGKRSPTTSEKLARRRPTATFSPPATVPAADYYTLQAAFRRTQAELSDYKSKELDWFTERGELKGAVNYLQKEVHRLNTMVNRPRKSRGIQTDSSQKLPYRPSTGINNDKQSKFKPPPLDATQSRQSTGVKDKPSQVNQPLFDATQSRQSTGVKDKPSQVKQPRVDALPSRVSSLISRPSSRAAEVVGPSARSTERENERQRVAPKRMSTDAKELYQLVSDFLTQDEKMTHNLWMSPPASASAFLLAHHISYKTLVNRSTNSIRRFNNSLFVWSESCLVVELSNDEIADLRLAHSHLESCAPSTAGSRIRNIIGCMLCSECVSSKQFTTEVKWLLQKIGGGPKTAEEVLSFRRSVLRKSLAHSRHQEEKYDDNSHMNNAFLV